MMDEPPVTPQRVLVVDDEKFNRQALADLLKEECTVLLAKDGDQALSRARADPPPDLILLDVVMPGTDGMEVLRRLKADPATADLPVIFVTGLSEEADEERGLQLGAVDYVTKPFRPAVIRARVRNHLTLVWQRKALERMAQRDGLTGLANRRHFDEVLALAWRRAARDGHPISLIMVDIDHFKPFNDHYGHQAGDEALTALAGVLEEAGRRPDDLVARWGGEEFAVLLPGSDTEDGRRIAELIRAGVARLDLAHALSPAGRLTVSLGVASREATAGGTPAGLVESADACLYQAKSEGRDRVAGPTPATREDCGRRIPD